MKTQKIISTALLVLLALTMPSEAKPYEKRFKLNDVEVAEEMLKEASTQARISRWFGSYEVYSKLPSQLCDIDASVHPFLLSVHVAYASHRPLRISPDHIWLLITQGFAAHVNHNAEALRSRFVEHQGKLTLNAYTDMEIANAEMNDWYKVIFDLCNQIGKHIGPEQAQLFTSEYSTTTINERIAFGISLLDAMSSYFSYFTFFSCGIPSITLEGEPKDWADLRHRAQQLAQYDLEWWINELDPILEEFVNASRGRVNIALWNNIYVQKEVKGCGGPNVTGWIARLFPYLRGAERNPIFQTKDDLKARLMLDDFPSGLSVVPFQWLFDDTTHEMEFIGGFLGISQEQQSKTLQPEIGWLIRKKPQIIKTPGLMVTAPQ